VNVGSDEFVCLCVVVEDPIPMKKDDNMSKVLMEFNAHHLKPYFA
jgi:hypothetical protein